MKHRWKVTLAALVAAGIYGGRHAMKDSVRRDSDSALTSSAAQVPHSSSTQQRGGHKPDDRYPANGPRTPAMAEAEKLLTTERLLLEKWKRLQRDFEYAPAAVWNGEVERFRARHSMQLRMLEAGSRPDFMGGGANEQTVRKLREREFAERCKSAAAAFNEWRKSRDPEESAEAAMRAWLTDATASDPILADARRLSLLLHREPPEREVLRSSSLN